LFKLQLHERYLSALIPTANSQPLWESFLYISFTAKSFGESSCNSTDFHRTNNWFFMWHSWRSLLVFVSPTDQPAGHHAALCVPDAQADIRTSHVGNKAVALVLVFITCVHESFYSAVSADTPLP